ncbi:hypothetical protein ACHAXA_000428, partial [Cyclostephanos tholiformis]
MRVSCINFHGRRHNLWESSGTALKYLPSYNLCATGMSRNRFDDIWYAVRWSCQPPEQPLGMSSEQYRWMLVDDFVANINEYCARTFVPGGHLEADESMIWIPHYAAIERKPDNSAGSRILLTLRRGLCSDSRSSRARPKRRRLLPLLPTKMTTTRTLLPTKVERGRGFFQSWWHHGKTADASSVIIEVPQPKAITKYYKGAGTIDRHNRLRADELRLDLNPGTKHWDKRFNIGVLSIICVDAYLFFQQVVSTNSRTRSCLEFFGRLADELIDNQEGIRITWAAADTDAGGDGSTDAAEPTVRKTIKMKHKKVLIAHRGDAAARTARGNRSSSAARARTPPTLPRNSSGSATLRRWRGASASQSTSTPGT